MGAISYTELLIEVAREAERTGVEYSELRYRILWLGWHCYLDNLANESEEQ